LTSQVTYTEPAWLEQRRAAARATYTSLPVPTTREEAWRYTNLRGFDPDAFEVVEATGASTEREGLMDAADVAGTVVQRGARVVSESLQAEGGE